MKLRVGKRPDYGVELSEPEDSVRLRLFRFAVIVLAVLVFLAFAF